MLSLRNILRIAYVGCSPRMVAPQEQKELALKVTVPTIAEINLRLALNESKKTGHAHNIASVIGVYPC